MNVNSQNYLLPNQMKILNKTTLQIVHTFLFVVCKAVAQNICSLMRVRSKISINLRKQTT